MTYNIDYKYKVLSDCSTDSKKIQIKYKLKYKSKQLKLSKTSIQIAELDLDPILEEGEINLLEGLTFNDLTERMVADIVKNDIFIKLKELITYELEKRKKKGWSRWEEVVIDLNDPLTDESLNDIIENVEKK
jgi:hypothetical protein